MAAHLNFGVIASIIALFFLVGTSNGDRIIEKIYHKIDGGFSCFRRLNGTHQVGCSSSQSGNVGVVHFVANEDDIKWVIDSGPHPPYVILLPPDMFRRVHLTRLEESNKISGVVVLNRTSLARPTQYSNDLSCPNKLSGLYKDNSYCEKEPWNPPGDGLLYEEFNFPIFFINETVFNQSVLLDDCYYKFNQPFNGVPPSYPLCAIELKAFMWAAVDTPTCLRRGRLSMSGLNPQPSKFCDPLSNVNVFAPLLAANKSDGPVRNRSVIFVSSRMDSASIFDGLSVGADTAITGLVTLVAVADMLSKTKQALSRRDVDNIVFVLFNGESFDYIGSSRMAYDMQTGNFPEPLRNVTPSQWPLIGLEHVKYWIELGSLAPRASQTVYLHSDPLSTNDGSVRDKVDQIINAIKDNQERLNIVPVDRSIPLPPASLQSFLKKDLKIPGLLVSNHERAFTNPFYNSEWDTFESISSATLVRHLAAVARTVASAVYQLAVNRPLPVEVQTNVTLVEQTLQCYLVNANCSLFNWLLNGRNNLIGEGVLPTYVGVANGDASFQALPLRTRHLLTMVTGQQVQVNRSECRNSDGDEIYGLYWMGESESKNITGTCYKSTVWTSLAVSPAFVIDDYNWTSGEYSSWTESVWDGFSVRIFLKASFAQEISVLVFGCIIFLLSFAVTYWISIRADHLFPTSSGDDPTTC